eukprot:3449384-Pleurochrysis_carterae.AAC.3
MASDVHLQQQTAEEAALAEAPHAPRRVTMQLPLRFRRSSPSAAQIFALACRRATRTRSLLRNECCRLPTPSCQGTPAP